MPHADDAVGYGKPPTQTRFKKGQSGNPHGRPKGAPNLATTLARALKEPVVVTERGRKTTITKFEAAVKQLVNKAASGEARAIAQLLTLVHVVETQGDPHDPAAEVLPEADQQVRAKILRRLTRQVQQGGPNHGTHTQPE